MRVQEGIFEDGVLWGLSSILICSLWSGDGVPGSNLTIMKLMLAMLMLMKMNDDNQMNVRDLWGRIRSCWFHTWTLAKGFLS